MTRQRLPANVKLLSWASCLNDVASEMIYPLLPQFLMTALGGSKFVLGLIEGVAETIASLLKLVSGAWSDRTRSRRGFVVFGYALAGLARPLIGLATAPWQLFAIRSADRVGKGIRTSPRDAMIADSTEPNMRGRAFGFHRAMDHLGAAIGPLLAAAFLFFWPGELRLMFLLTIIPGIVVVGLLVLRLREPMVSDRAVSEPPREAPRLTLKPFDRGFRLYLLSLVVFTLGNASDAFLLVRAGELGVPTAMLPLLWFAFHVVKSGGNLIVGRLVDRIGPRPPLFAGWLLYAATYLAFALATAAWQAWLYFLLYGVFYAMTESAEKTLVTQLAGPERKGLAFGWYNFTIGIAALPASLLFGLLYDQYGALAAFGTSAGLALGAVVLLAGVGKVE